MQNSPKPSQTTEDLSTNTITSNTGKTKKPKSSKKAKATKSQKSSNIFKIILLVVLVPIVILISGVIWYVMSLNPLTNTDQYKVVTVEQGASTSQIASTLQDNSVIKSARAFTIYIRLNGVNNLQAGTYRLSSADPVAKIVKIISSGETTTDNLLISPGLRLDQIVTLLENEGYKKSDIDSALDEVRDHPLLTNYPDNKRLEGYLYPDTYQVEPTTTAKQLIKSILDNFNDAITPKIKQGVKNQGLTLDQAIILASIVQKEVADPEVQKTVAQVFIKRFKEGNVLGSDVTYKYAAKQFGTPDNPDSNSPYNTRKFVGLPPTAISNFNLSALIAVSNPTNTDYNYFVAGDDGKTYFSNTLQQHNQNIADHCIKGCQ